MTQILRVAVSTRTRGCCWKRCRASSRRRATGRQGRQRPRSRCGTFRRRSPGAAGSSAARTVEAVRDVSLVVRKGETLAVVGESGSGKSTLARCTVRLTRASSGEVLLAGEDIAQLEPRALFGRSAGASRWSSRTRSARSTRAGTVAAALIEGPVNYGVSREEALERAQAAAGPRRVSGTMRSGATRTSSRAASASASASPARSPWSPTC